MSPTACDGCLGTDRCWVCVGEGLLTCRGETFTPCHRCYGSGHCPWCQEIKIADIEEPPVLRVGPVKLRRRRRSDAQRAGREDARR